MSADLMQMFAGLSEAQAMHILRGLRGEEPTRHGGLFLCKVLDRGRLLEVQLGLDGRASAVSVFRFDESKTHPASRCLPTPEMLRRLGEAPAGALAEDLLDGLVGPERAGLAHLGTRLEADGAQVRAYALPGGGVVEVRVATDGSSGPLRMICGHAGLMRVRQALESSWRLPERHRTYPTVRTWGEAYAHARSMGGAVISVREHFGDRPRVVLACERPQQMGVDWFPRFAKDGPEPAMPRERFTRTYRIQDRGALHVADMGQGPSALEASQWALLATVLQSEVHSPSAMDLQVARAALEQLLLLLEGPPVALSKVGLRVRERHPRLFTRDGVLAALRALPSG